MALLDKEFDEKIEGGESLVHTTEHSTITTNLSEFLVRLDYDSLSKETIDQTKLCILDTLGCILAGTKDTLMPNLVKEFADNSSKQEATVLGYGKKTSLFGAGLLNGTMGHAVEMDDVHKKGKVHPGTVVIPGVLSYGELNHCSGKKAILATVVGYEAMNRIGTAINAAAHRFQGWHSTGTCGTFGVAAALAKLSDFSKEQFISALGLAGTQSSGLWAFTADGATNKMFHAGHAVTSGMTAVRLVKAGMTGPSQILEAEDGGLFKASSYDYYYEPVTQDLGETLSINEVFRKPYACCRSMHPSIEAVLKIQEKYQIDIADIKSIKVKTYKVAKIQCGFTNKPQSVADARFSIPYGVAVALYDGNALMDQFTDERIKDTKVLSLAEKVEIEVDDRFDSAYPNRWGCCLEMEMVSGETYVEVVEDAKGDATNPLTLEEFESKFIYLSNGVLEHGQALEVIEAIKHLEDIEDIGQLVELCIRK